MTLNSEALLPCPFCEAPAEVDMSRSFRAMQSGKLETGVSIYCSAGCHVEMMLCRSDFPEYDDNQLFAILAENWNRRPALPSGDELVERLRARRTVSLSWPDACLTAIQAEHHLALEAVTRIRSLMAEVAELDAECQQSMLDIARERERAETAEARVKVLGEALEPFAAISDDYSANEEDDFQVWKDFDVLGASLPLKIFRRARSALNALGRTGE